MRTDKNVLFVQGIGLHEPFNLWHAVKRNDEYAYTTMCDLYMMSVRTADTIENIPSADYDKLCKTEACRMRSRISYYVEYMEK